MSVEMRVKEGLSNYLDNLRKHEVFDNPYFKYLSENKWDKDIFEIFRANYFYRTELTVKGIAYVCHQSSFKNDMDTLILFTYILNEETGSGKKSFCHEVLMEKAFNTFGEKEFGLEFLPVVKSKDSNLIIRETHQYRDTILEFLTKSYCSMLGVAMALESHADIMLNNLRNGFRGNRKNVDKEEFVRDIEVYFNAHVESGVEERHADDAKLCVINNCATNNDLTEIIEGANAALEAQKNMWYGLLKNTVNEYG